MPAESTFLEQAKSRGSVSCQTSTEPPEWLRLQPGELIVSESVLKVKDIPFFYPLFSIWFKHCLYCLVICWCQIFVFYLQVRVGTERRWVLEKYIGSLKYGSTVVAEYELPILPVIGGILGFIVFALITIAILCYCKRKLRTHTGKKNIKAFEKASVFSI